MSPTDDAAEAVRRPGAVLECDRRKKRTEIAAVFPDWTGEPGTGDAFCQSCLAWAMRDAHPSRKAGRR